MKKITLFMFLLFGLLSSAQISIGTGTLTQRSPLAAYYGFSRTASLYTAAEIQGFGSITKLAWETSAASSVVRPIKIYLKTTTATTLTASSWPTLITGATLVYDSSNALSSGFNEFTLSSSFSFPSDNLIVLVETNFGGSGSTEGTTSTAVKYSTSTDRQLYLEVDTTAPTTASLVLGSSRPNIKITGLTLSCQMPTAITRSAITASSATISWTASAPVPTVGYEYEVRSSGAAGSGATGLGAGGTTAAGIVTANVTGLVPLTTYTTYVRANCAVGDYSGWAASSTFTTLSACPGTAGTVTKTAITTNSATITWVASPTPPSDGYQYEIRTSGAAGSGTTGLTSTATVAAGVLTANLTGLTSLTTYSIYIRTYCGGSFYGAWTSASTFVTQGLTISPWSEPFVAALVPNGWSGTLGTIGSARGVTGNPGNNIYMNLYSTQATGNFSTINVGPVLTDDKLSFDYKLASYSSPYTVPTAGSGNFVVAISTDLGVTFTTLETVANDGITGWKTKEYSLAAYAGMNVKVRITGNWISGDYDLALDNFKIEGPSCTWNGTAWSNTVGPDATLNATILGAYSTTTNGSITAKKIMVTSGSLTVNSGTNITIEGALINNLTATAVVIENNANIVQTTGTTNTNTGNVTIKRTTNPLMLLDYVMWGSPVATQQLQAFSPTTLSSRFYSYNTATNLYSTETATNNFADGKGYLIRMPNNHPTTATAWNGSFVGVPHNGDYTFTPAVGFNSVANPYPSTISMATFVADNPTITGTLYFWRKTNSTTVLPGYCSWNSGTYVTNGQPGAITDAAGNDMLQVGQGFIVKATATTGVLFKNTQRTANNAGQTYKSGVSATTSTDEKNRIWLNLTSTDGNFSQTAFGYMTNATNEVDSYDGESFNDGNISLSSVIADQKFVIQGKELPFQNTDLVPLNYKVSQPGSYTIAIDNVDGLFANTAQNVYLRDLLLNTETNLSTGAYTFASSIGEFNNRFVVAYTPQTLGIPQFNADSVVVYTNSNNVVVNSGNTAMESVRVFDLTGRLLVDRNNINATSFSLSVNAKNQVILVQVKDINGNVVSKKVIN